MLDVLHQDYIRTAYAKGLTTRAVVLRHAMKGAMLPVVSFLGPAVAGILTGSVVIEYVFAIPGLGFQFVQSATAARLHRGNGPGDGLHAPALHDEHPGRHRLHGAGSASEIELMTSVPHPTNSAAELNDYAALLKEAEQIRGVSLARDAWRRLRAQSSGDDLARCFWR